MFKLFTLERAHHLLPTVEMRLSELRGATDELDALRARAREARGGTPEAYALGQEIAFVARTVQEAKDAVRRLGVLVPDVSEGTVEFPSRVDGEIVHLVWHPGDDVIRSYHRLAGDERLRPLATPEGPPETQSAPSASTPEPGSPSGLAGSSSGTSSSTSAGSN